MTSSDREPMLTYCTNVYPGEDWSEVRACLAREVPDVKRELGASSPFGVGLRLGARAARSLADPSTLEELRAVLGESELYVATLNGFPYGSFHGARVKEDVFRPDWRDRARLEYTNDLARVLLAILPPAMDGSISTLPGADRRARHDPGAVSAIAGGVLEHAALLHDLHGRTGRTIRLALEPEPFAMLESTEEAVTFFEEHLLARDSLARFAVRTGLARSRAEEVVREHVGLCLDACHMAVLFEEPVVSLDRIRRAGVRVPKIQVSAALEVDFDERGEDGARALRSFADDVYLHQVVERGTGRRWRDLDEALHARRAGDGGTWRVHFHVPVFRSAIAPFRSTQPYVRDLLELSAPERPLYEVETYTWAVLPPSLREPTLARSIARELTWTAACLRG